MPGRAEAAVQCSMSSGADAPADSRSWQEANRSDARRIARICDAATGAKAQRIGADWRRTLH